MSDSFMQLKEREDSLHAETKKRKEAEQQLVNKKTEVQNIQKSRQEMLNKIEGLKNHNSDLQKERDKIVRDLEEFRVWIEGLASSGNRSVYNFTEFSYLELMEGTNNFEDFLKIGEGGYGKVYRGSLRHTTVAIKILRHESRHGEREFNQEVISSTNVLCPMINTLSCSTIDGINTLSCSTIDG
jgi:chromosome segregation ATPase